MARAAGEDRVAARLAIALVLDCTVFRGAAEASGWLERAASLLEGSPPCEERGMLTYMRGMLALRAGHDPGAAAAFAAEGVAMARDVGAVDGEMACLALEGLARVTAGDVAEGMRRLDEATTAAVAGEVADARLVQIICCHLIDACMRARDFDRATEWCRRVEEIATRFDDVEMFGACRISYGEVLCLGAARGPRPSTRSPPRVATSRGHRAGCSTAWCASPSCAAARAARMTPPPSSPRPASIRWASWCAARSRSTPAMRPLRARRRSASCGASGRPTASSVSPLWSCWSAPGVQAGELGAAQAAAAELEATAAAVGTAPLRACALLARGRLSLADPGAACAALEDAADLLRAAGVRFEAAHGESRARRCPPGGRTCGGRAACRRTGPRGARRTRPGR